MPTNWFKKQMRLDLDRPGEIAYWAGRWDISPLELKNAIIETGSLNIIELRRHLRTIGALPAFPSILRTVTTRWKGRKAFA